MSIDDVADIIDSGEAYFDALHGDEPRPPTAPPKPPRRAPRR